MSAELEPLLERLRQGDREALDELLQRHLPGLRAFVRLRSGPLLRATESSSDLVQSVCREVLSHMQQFRYPSDAGFRRWLYATALRKIQNRYQYWHAVKRDAGRAAASSEASAADLERVGAAYVSFSSPSRAAMSLEEIRRIEAAFDQLPEDYREVIVLSRIVGMSHAAIAEQMDRGEGAVRMLLARALGRLAQILDLEGA